MICWESIRAFKQNDTICLEEHFGFDMETKPSSSGAPAIVWERMGVI